MFESEHKLRHLAFVEEIAQRPDDHPESRAAIAGFVILRLVDAWVADGPRLVRQDEFGLRSVRNAVEEVTTHAQLRTLLLGVFDVIEQSKVVDIGLLASRLMAYGQLLEYDAKWSLASDVYDTIISHAHPTQEADVATQAHLRRGFCLRQVGHLKASLAAYHMAARLADASNDIVGVLQARLGEAKTALTLGNIPRAEAILSDTLARASGSELQDVRSRALHDSAVVAAFRGDYERSIKLAYEALEISMSPREHDRILGDIAAFFHKLGVRSAARDAYLVLAATAQEQYARWVATLNLMEIAAEGGDELLFEQYRRSVEPERLNPEVRATFWQLSGEGYERLGHLDAARTYLQRALAVAEEYSLHQVVFDVERALTQLGGREAPMPVAESPLSAAIEGVASVLRDRRAKIGV